MFFKKESNMVIKQKASFVERGYYVYHKTLDEFYINVVIEGESINDVVISDMKKAIHILSNINPCMRLNLCGFLNFTYLFDTKIPPIFRVVEKSSWDGMSSDTIDFLCKDSDIKKRPLAEIIYIKGSPVRIVFRFHHILTDARGALLWIEDLFRILRNEKPESYFSKMSEYNVMLKNKIKGKKILSKYYITPTGLSEGKIGLDRRFIRRKIAINNKISNLTGQIAVLAAKAAREINDGEFCVTIPVDLRFRENNIKTTRNFSSTIYVEVNKNDTPADIILKILKQLRNKEDLKFEYEDIYSIYFPIFLLEYITKKKIYSKFTNNLFTSSATISNIGFIDTAKLSTENFITNSLFVFNLQYYSPAFFLVTNCNNSNLEITLSVPDVLRTNKRDEKLLDKIVEGIEKGDVHIMADKL